MVRKLLLFAGTTEGRLLAEALSGADLEILASVATEYGKSLLPPVENLRIRVGRLTRKEIEALLDQEGIDCAVDATHPYAVEATANLSKACAGKGVPYFRLTRETSDTAGCIRVPSMEAAAAYLSAHSGNALLTVGSQGLQAFTVIPGWQDRLYARVLPLPEALEKCAALGFTGRHIIAMQGPFSAGLNEALLRETGSVWLVTKDSGANGGFAEKRAGADRASAKIIVVGRPEEVGISLEEFLEILRVRCGTGRSD